VKVLVALLVVGAIFAACGPSDYELAAAVSPAGGGSVSPAGGIYEAETQVAVEATPAQGYRFDHWEGNASGRSPGTTVFMDRDQTITAHFVKLCELSTYASLADGGVVSPEGGIYDCGTQVTLVAEAADCYSFDGWGGDADGRSSSLTITLDSDMTVGASFTRNEYSVSAVESPLGSGTVRPGNGTYECGTEVTLSAEPAVGYRFDRWEGDASTVSPVASLIMDADKTATAYFTRVHTLFASVLPVEGGSVSPGSGVHDAGTKVTLTATAAFPFAFVKWNGTDNDLINPTTATILSDRSVNAVFWRLYERSHDSLEDIRLSGQEVRVSWPLSRGDWVDGQMYVREHYIKARIEDSTGAVVLEIPKTRGTAFRFQANTSGPYRLVVYETPGRVLYDYFNVEYSIYSPAS